MTSTWWEELHQAKDKVGDTSRIVHLAPNPEAFDVEFDDDWGNAEGPEVLAWTEERVYFPVVYDGAEWLGSAPRNPTNQGQHHEGGQ